jgi:preprotein translocase SecE subunit
LEKSVADETGGRKKRLVKNPETFREKALKANEESAKPKRQSRVKKTVASLLRLIWRPFGWFFSRVGKVLGRFRVFRWLGKLLFPGYFRSSWQELKLVTWPNWQQSRRLTTAVLIFAAVFGVVIAIVDYGLDKLFRDILLK